MRCHGHAPSPGHTPHLRRRDVENPTAGCELASRLQLELSRRPQGARADARANAPRPSSPHMRALLRRTGVPGCELHGVGRAAGGSGQRHTTDCPNELPLRGRPRVAPSGRGGSWCERWHPTKVFSGGEDAMYAEDVNPDGTLAKVLVERSRGPVVEVAIATSARHTVTKDGITHLFTYAPYDTKDGSRTSSPCMTGRAMKGFPGAQG